VNGDRRIGRPDRRANLRVTAVFAVKSLLRGRLQLGQAEDLGPGGMTLRRLPDQPAAVGTAITLVFALPEGGEGATLLKVQGVVVSDALAGTFRRTGVRFLPAADEARGRITRFCMARAEEAAARFEGASAAASTA
jgi:hypothetical protein